MGGGGKLRGGGIMRMFVGGLWYAIFEGSGPWFACIMYLQYGIWREFLFSA